MKTLTTAVFLGLIFISNCVTPTRQGAYPHSGNQRQRWPLGHYELVSFNGRSLPVELPDGTTIEAGSVALSERRAWSAGGKGVSFRMKFQFPDTLRRQQLRYGSRRGYVWLVEEPSEDARTSLEFEALQGTIEEGVSPGFDEFPLEWWDPTEASATLFGNELRVGEGGKLLVFMRR